MVQRPSAAKSPGAESEEQALMAADPTTSPVTDCMARVPAAPLRTPPTRLRRPSALSAPSEG